VNWVIDLFLTLLVCMCRILGRARHLGPGIELGDYLSFHSYTFPSLMSLAFWHSHLGHAFMSRVQVLASKGLLGSMSNDSFDCIYCQLGKQSTLPLHDNESIASASFDLIHSDVWGPSPIPSMSDSRYFVIFVDGFSRYTWVFLMKSRSELLDIYRNFEKMVET
jgi:hypothetical protein